MERHNKIKILGYIPARSGSKGVPDKNIKPVHNVPLLAFSVFTAMDCLDQEIFTHILLSTDSKLYTENVSRLGYDTDYLRPSEFCKDNSPTVDGILHALDWYKKSGVTFDAVMILQPTAPFRTPDHITNAISLLKQNKSATCVAGIKELGDCHPARIKKLLDGIWIKDFCDNAREPEPSRRQDFYPSAYLRNGAIYLTPTSVLEKRLIRGRNVIGLDMPEANSINVDDHIDFISAQSALSYEPYKKYLSYFDLLLEIFNS